MNAGQYEGIVGRLDAILGKMPAVPRPDPRPFTVHHLDGTSTVTRPTLGVTRNEQETGAYLALVAMDRALDSWIEGAKENHQALEHRYENTGEECWRSFAPSDIRNMINDAATELGLAEFRAPAEPEEDKPL